MFRPAEHSPGFLTRFTRDEVLAAIAEFQTLLDSEASEGIVHAFLATHCYFWHGVVRHTTICPVYSKVRLGSQYEIDFAHFDESSSGAEWSLIEIERPSARLFNSKGDPSGDLTHALAQVRNWQTWIHRNRSAAQEIMPEIDHPIGIVFMGRRSELGAPGTRERLRMLNYQNRANVEVRTLDRFVDNAMSAITLGQMTLPSTALNDRDLRAGLPPAALDWIRSPFARERLFLEDREHRTRFDEDRAIAERAGPQPEEVTFTVAPFTSAPKLRKAKPKRSRSIRPPNLGPPRTPDQPG